MTMEVIDGRRVFLPDRYRGHATQTFAFYTGFRQGLVADQGGTPLSKYRQPQVKAAHAEGFRLGQFAKRLP